MTLDEQITEIARNMAYSIHVGRGPVLQGTIDGIKSACYAAIRAALEREPSEAMLHAIDDWIGSWSGVWKSDRDGCYNAYRAMTAQLIKELGDE